MPETPKPVSCIDLVIDHHPLRVLPFNWPGSRRNLIYNDDTKKGIVVCEYTEPCLEYLRRNIPLLLKTYCPINISPGDEEFCEAYRKINGEKKQVYSIELSPENFNRVIEKAGVFENIAKNGFVTVDQLLASTGLVQTPSDWLTVNSQKYDAVRAELTELEQFLDKFVGSILCFEGSRGFRGSDVQKRELTLKGYAILKELFP